MGGWFGRPLRREGPRLRRRIIIQGVSADNSSLQTLSLAGAAASHCIETPPPPRQKGGGGHHQTMKAMMTNLTARTGKKKKIVNDFKIKRQQLDGVMNSNVYTSKLKKIL